jgi:ribonuclease T1
MKRVLIFAVAAIIIPAPACSEPVESKHESPAPKGVPDKVMKVLKHVDEKGEPLDGYEGGRSFGNFEKRLPQTDDKGRRIRYHEWDVNPLKKGVNRGPERLITGSDGTAWYTGDHYETFTKVRDAKAAEKKP